MSIQPFEPLPVGHMVCVVCRPDMDGPAICGAPFDGGPVSGTCEQCNRLAFAPCPECQSAAHEIWARLLTVDDVEHYLWTRDNEFTRDCG